MPTIEELTKARRELEDEELGVSMAQSSRESPEQSAKVYNLSQQKNLPVEYVGRHYDKVNRPNVNQLSPRVRELLKDPQRAAIAQDDTDNLGWWDSVGRELKALGQTAESAYHSTLSGGAGVLTSVGEFFSVERLMTQGQNPFIAAEIEKLVGPGDIAGKMAEKTAAFGSQERAKAEEAFPTDSAIPDPVLSGVKSFVMNAPVAAAGILSRRPELALGGMSSIAFGDAYIQAKEAGLGENEAMVFAMAQGSIEYSTEKIPVFRFIEDLTGGSGFARTVIRQMAAEIPGEQAATALQDFMEWAAINKEKTFREYLEERPGRAAETLVSTIVATGLQTSTIAGADRLFRRGEQKAIDEIKKKADESKVNSRAPEIFQEYLQDGEYGNVYLSAEDIQPIYSELEQDAAFDLINEQFSEASRVGGNVVIPMDKFASVVTQSPNFAKLREMTRLTPDKGSSSQEVNEILQEAEQNIQMRQEADQIYKQVSEQLIQTGRMDQRTAKTSAAIIPAYVTTKAVRSGMSVKEVYDMMGLKIVGPKTEVPQGRQILDQIAEKVPEDYKPKVLNQSYTNEDLQFFREQGLLTEQEITNLETYEDTPRAGEGIPGQQRPEAVVKPVYRGSAQPLQSQDFQALGAATGHPSAALGVFFTSDQADASRYGEVQEHQLTLENPKSFSIEEDIPAFSTPEEYTQFREELQAQGHDGIVFDYSSVDGPVHYVAFEETSVGETFKQDESQPRGSITFLPDSAIIRLSEASDLTTFLHESGHLFLEMEKQLYNHPNATEQMKADGDIILKWLGVESFDNIQTEQHEQFARGFEKYLGEGKAPSVELQSAFRRFAAWIKKVYLNLTRLNVELNDDIRGVIDRLLATDEQIDRMKGRFRPLFESAEDAGATQAEYDAYTRKSTPDTAKEDLQAKLLKQLERQHKQWWADESRPIKDRIRKELLETPVYKAVDKMRNAKSKHFASFKMNRDEVKQALGLDKIDRIPSKFNKLTGTDGLPIDELAGIYGFASGQDMVDQIKEAPSLSQEVNRLAHEEMVRRHGDALNDGTLQEMAEQAARNPEHAKKLSSEIAFLARKTGRQSIDRESLKEYARETIGKLSYKKIYPNSYRAAEVRAARSAAVAKSQGNLEEALRYKQQELTQFYLAKEAQRSKDKALKARAFMKGVQTKKYDSKNYDNETVNQAKVLISAFDFRVSNRESQTLARARLDSVRNWIKSQNVDPEAVSNFVEAEVLGKLIPYDQMTTEDLRGLEDVVKSLLFGAKAKANIETENYKKDIEKGREWLQENRIKNYETEIDTDVPWVKAKNFGRQFLASLRKFESLVRQADGMNDQGWLWKKTVKPLLDAANDQLRIRRQAFEELNKIFSGYEKVFNGLKDRQTFTLENGRKIRLSYGARISLALNTGNEGNLEAILTQGMTTPESTPLMTQRDVDNILSALTDKDWDLVQNVWDYVDTFWPQISELEIKRSGVAPQKVEPRSFTTPTGKKMRGGYYPLVGDPMEDAKQLDQDISSMADAMRAGGTAKKTTKHGSTIERVGFGGKKVNLSIDVLFNHIDGVVHDITHWEAVRDVDRVLRNPKISEELNTSLGKPGARVLKDRLTEIAAGPIRTNGLSAWNRMLRHARLAATYNALGYSVRTALMNTLGLTTAIADMDARSVSAGAYEFYTNPKQMTDFILSKSTYMQDRGEVLNRDVAYIRANLKGDTKFNKFKDNAFWLMTKTDQAITRPIWLAAYRQGETMFDTEQAAIDHADRMVARTQGSGFDLDLANVETRNEFVKTFTVMYSAMSAIYGIGVEQINRYQGGKITVPQLMAKMSWLVVIPALIELLITGKDDEDEPLPEAAAKNVAFYSLGLIPWARDVASYARYGSSFPTPIVSLGQAPFDVASQLSQGEVDKAFVRSIGSAASIFHVPGGAQFSRTVGYLTEVQDNEIDEFSPYDMIVTGREREDLIGD